MEELLAIAEEEIAEEVPATEELLGVIVAIEEEETTEFSRLLELFVLSVATELLEQSIGGLLELLELTTELLKLLE